MLRRPRRVAIFVFVGATVCFGPAHPNDRLWAQTGGEGNWPIIERIGKGFVAGEEMPHDNLPACKRGLSKAEQLENFDILWKAIDRHYSFFDLKNIDWQKVKNRYHFRVQAATGDNDYYRVLFDLVRELKDLHSYPYNYPINLPAFAPHVCTHQIEGKAVVTFCVEGSEAFAKGLGLGAVITRIDGRSVAERIEQLRPLLRMCSSERAFLETAYRQLLAGERGTTVGLTFFPPGRRVTRKIELQRVARMPRGEPWQYRALPFPVEKGEFLWFGVHPSRYGYIRIVTFKGRQEIADEFDRALETLRDTPGLIIDIRDNDGGSGVSQHRIIGRLITAQKKVATSFRKNGPGHQDFTHHDIRFSPTGDWQYTKPVALLTNAVTGSAADLFACTMRGTGRVITVGTTTHGDLPGFSVVAVLPCGLVVRVSNAYVADNDGRPIELNGNAPQVHAEPTVKDVLEGTDSVIARAVQALRAAPSRATPDGARPDGIGHLAPRPRAMPAAGGNNQEDNVYNQVLPLEFTLRDAYDREVRAEDYRGVPVLISTGPCWCAHCQGDADVLPVLAERYRGRGLQVIRITSYDNNLPVWEFHKHYRLPFVQLLDPIREFDRRYNRRGWPFFMLVDGAGRVVFRKNIEVADYWQELARLLESMLPKRAPVERVEREGISYMPATVERSGESTRVRHIDRFPSLACAKDGRVYVAFTTNRGGTQDVYLRVFDGNGWLPDRPVAATEADEFDGTVIVDRQNRPWVAWTSNAGGPPYNIFVTCAPKSTSRSAPIQITHGNPQDGAMHPRMTVDPQGRIWLVYYQWERLKNMGTRVKDQQRYLFENQWDKEIYARYFEQRHWSGEIHVSPEDAVPTDDHTDPAMAPFGNGVVIGWSWDFHQRNFNRAYADNKISDQPSIFLRTVERGPKFARARAVSGPNVDSRPALAVASDGRVLCAWESVQRDRNTGDTGKMIAASVEDLNRGEQPGAGVNVTGLQKDICTPCLAASPKGEVTLVWAELSETGQWTLKNAHWESKRNGWTTPQTLVSNGDPRFPSAAYDKNGELWIAYCVDKGNRREVAVLRHAGGGVGEAIVSRTTGPDAGVLRTPLAYLCSGNRLVNHAIELEKLTKRFGSCLAVDNLDLVVPEGAIYGFIGPNGSGKTTTLRMILRILYPDSGRITVLGCDRGTAADDRVGYLPEERGLYRKMRVRDVLRFFARLKGMRRCDREIDDWLERFDLARWASERVETLSKGMAQKVQFIAAIVAKPRLLVLDEPFTGLDPVNMDVLRNAVQSAHQGGTTVIFSTHDMDVAERLCDTIFMICRGRKVLDGTLAAIQAQFGDDTIRLRTADADSSLADLPGVMHVNDQRHYKELRIGRDADPRAILQELLKRTTVEHFELARPSLHDIFVRIAGPEPRPADEAPYA